MPDDYGLSAQDIQDLQAIKGQLPQGDPRSAKIETLLGSYNSPAAQPGAFQTKPKGMILNSNLGKTPTQFEQQNAMPPNERQANSFLLGTASGASGLKESQHPIADTANAINSSFAISPDAGIGDVAKQALRTSLAPMPGVALASGLYNAGKQFFSPQAANEDLEDAAERRAHGLGSAAGIVAPAVVGEGVSATRTGLGRGLAGAVATPAGEPKPLGRLTIGADRAKALAEIADPRIAERAADEARAGEINAAKTMQDPVIAQEGAARNEAYEQKAQNLIRRGREQDILDRRAALAAKNAPPPDPFAGATSTSTPVGNEPLPPPSSNFNSPPTMPPVPGITRGVPAPSIASAAPTNVPDPNVVLHLPEPNEPIPGIPNNMGSTPRDALFAAADRGQAGAGAQIQSLAQPIVYTSKGAGYGGPRPGSVVNINDIPTGDLPPSTLPPVPSEPGPLPAPLSGTQPAAPANAGPSAPPSELPPPPNTVDLFGGYRKLSGLHQAPPTLPPLPPR